jgi:hypothetical protein
MRGFNNYTLAQCLQNAYFLSVAHGRFSTVFFSFKNLFLERHKRCVLLWIVSS